MNAPLDNSTFRLLAEEIGEQGARALCDHLGGTQLYIPAKIGEDHPIAIILGMELSVMLSKRFLGEILTIPRGRRTGDRAKVIELRKTTTMSIKQIALATGYHVRQVLRILEEDFNKRQMDLL